MTVFGTGVRAGIVAGVLSGVPSTLHALATRRDPLAATRAAGSLLLPDEARSARLLAAAIPVHFGLSVGWGVALAAVLPRRATTAWGALAGLAIAALDFSVPGRRTAQIRALPRWPQVADHLTYGVIAAAAVATAHTEDLQSVPRSHGRSAPAAGRQAVRDRRYGLRDGPFGGG
ncbi:hypothetical protein AB0478_38985 [Streptomyces sp. NPDC051917]|uniref:hypothetical protein n=1 Tax=Streptomyces sp. NPDC051917 TaxID=3154754 RepID=UPI0034523F48